MRTLRENLHDADETCAILRNLLQSAEDRIAELEAYKTEVENAITRSAGEMCVDGSKHCGCVPYLRTRVTALEAIVEKLPLTKDGVIIFKSVRVWFNTVRETLWLDVELLIPPSDEGYKTGWILCGPTQHDLRNQVEAIHCYSTRETAQAAKAEQERTQ